MRNGSRLKNSILTSASAHKQVVALSYNELLLVYLVKYENRLLSLLYRPRFKPLM